VVKENGRWSIGRCCDTRPRVGAGMDHLISLWLSPSSHRLQAATRVPSRQERVGQDLGRTGRRGGG
jgi:hypothetical protein